MNSEPAPGLDERQIRELEDLRRSAMVNADVKALSSVIGDKSIYVHSTGATESGRSYLDRLGSGDFGYDAIDVDDVQVLVVDQVAVVVYRQIASMRIGHEWHKAVSRCTATWVSRSGEPYMLSFQSTPIR